MAETLSEAAQGRAGEIMERAATRAAFEAILQHDFGAAQRALALAQAQAYGLKPWVTGRPEKDAVGNRLVYASPFVGRYTVHQSQPNGSHVRVLLGDPRYTGTCRDFEAWAKSSQEAKLLASLFANERGAKVEISDVSLTGGDEFIIVRFTEVP